MKTKADFLEKLGLNIRAYREKAGYTQTDFAFRLKMARRYYTDLENGRINPSIIHLMRIAFALGVDFSEFVPRGFSEKHLTEDK